MKRLLPASFYNPLSLIGAVVVVFNIGLMIFLTIVDMLSKHPSAYAGIIIFIILPLFILIGAVFLAVGIVRERRRQAAGLPAEHRLPVLDFNDQRQRKIVILVGSAFILLCLIYAFASYKAYEYVESNTFCGMVCHTVMGPEHSSHRLYSHAEVGCVDCHVGSGAKYFVESKVAGTRQLAALVLNKYQRPIPVPIENLRPAQDICETCHGPKTDFRERLVSKKHFLSDEKNTPWTINLLLKMGVTGIESGKPMKIHWHSTVAREIRYIATDPKRMVIPWIQATGLDGKVLTYRSTDHTPADSELSKHEERVMDCIDCHNRAGHPYQHPALPMNALLSLRVIDPALPEIKNMAIKVLEGGYTSGQNALSSIKTAITEFYQKKNPDVAAQKKTAIDKAIDEIQKIYRQNYDPVMKVNWRAFPDNSGHLYSPGCFRCHDGKHVSEDGKVLSKDCNLCHVLIKSQVGEERKAALLTVDPYPHPVDIGDSYRETNCSDCHGAASP
ncbi:MAG: cytochrome C [bacterium]